MKKLFTSLLLITATYSFANINHKTCLVERITEPTGAISKVELVNSLRSKGYQLKDNVILNSGNVPRNGLSVNLRYGINRKKKAIGRNAITSSIASIVNNTTPNQYSGSLMIQTSHNFENDYMPKYEIIYSNTSFSGYTYAEDVSELVDLPYKILESVPSCTKIN